MTARRARDFSSTRPQNSAESAAEKPSGRKRRHRVGGKRRRKTPERVARRQRPDQWSEVEILGLHEAVALLFPNGPLTASQLRGAIARSELAYVRISGRIYTNLAALAEMMECRRAPAGDGARPSDADWDAHLATLLPKRGGRDG